RAVEEDAGVVGSVVNLISFRLLAGGSAESLNVKGAYLEVLSDLLGSIGVIAAAIVVYTTGWTYADPLIGATVGLQAATDLDPREPGSADPDGGCSQGYGRGRGTGAAPRLARSRGHPRPAHLDADLGDGHRECSRRA